MEREAVTMIIQFFQTYGGNLTLIACSGIFILGILKFFHLFDRIEKSKRKYFYAIISTAISIAASAIYLLIIDGFEWDTFGIYAMLLFAFNQTIYSIYETYGIRAGLRKIGELFVGMLTKYVEKQKLENEPLEEEPKK